MAKGKLIPINTRSKGEQTEISRRGGIRSGEARRKKANVLANLRALLESDWDDVDGEKKAGAEMIAITLMRKAIQDGDLKAIEQILDRVYGKAQQKMDVTSSDGSMSPMDIQVSFVDETAKKG